MMWVESTTSGPPDARPPTAFAQPAYRLLWATWLVANVMAWSHDASVSWMLAAADASPALIALVQAAATLPVFLAVLPSGAIADLFDRRRILVGVYGCVGVFVLIVGMLVAARLAPPALLLASTFVMGLSLAIRLPAQMSLVHDAVPAPALGAAIVWNAAAMNSSRLLGPLVAGALLMFAPQATAFFVVGAVMLTVALMLHRRRALLPAPAVGGREKESMFEALRIGLRFSRETPAVRRVMALGAFQFFFAVALLALLPVIVRDRLQLGSTGFTLIHAAFGAGAIGYAAVSRILTARLGREQITVAASLVQAACSLAIASVPQVPVVTAAMFMAGFAWLALSAVLQVVAQEALPAWVRARALSALHMAFTGGATLGSLMWGQCAVLAGMTVTFALAGAGSLLATILARRLRLNQLEPEDVRVNRYWAAPSVDIPPSLAHLPVTVAVEFRIPPEHVERFLVVVQESRRLRMRGGSIDWRLRRDLEQPDLYIEEFVEPGWSAYLLHRDRVTEFEREIRDRKVELHAGPAPPRIRFWMECGDRAGLQTAVGAWRDAKA
jgi:MFS family permease